MSRTGSPVGSPGSLAASPQPALVTRAGLLVRPWRADDDGDVAAVLTAFADPEIQRWGMRDISTAEQARRWMDGWRAAWLAGTDACWAVERDGVVAGRVAVRWPDLTAGTAQVSFWVLPDARVTGVASGGAAEVVRWAFEEVGVPRLELSHSVHNEGSCAVAHRIGFALEGTLRDGMLQVDGWHDVHVHARSAARVAVPAPAAAPSVGGTN